MLYLFIRKIELPHYYASLKQQYRPNSITKAVDGLFKYNRNRA